MKTMSKLGLGVAVLALVAGCGSETPSHNDHAAANEQNIIDNGMIVDPEIPNAAAVTNGVAPAEPARGQDPVQPSRPVAVPHRAAQARDQRAAGRRQRAVDPPGRYVPALVENRLGEVPAATSAELMVALRRG